MKNVCTIYLVRHGRTDWNDKHLIQGHSDIELNSEGIETAKKLAKEFKKIKFDCVYSSDLLRAKQTAEIVALEQKIGIQTSESLRERNFGNVEGKPSQEYFSQINEVLEKLDEEIRYSYKFESNIEMESDREVLERINKFFKKISNIHNRGNILVVSHGGPIRLLLHKFKFLSYKEIVYIPNLSFIKLACDGKELKLLETFGIEK